jgi:hypothetical protein
MYLVTVLTRNGVHREVSEMTKSEFYTRVASGVVKVSGEYDDVTGLCIYQKKRGEWCIIDPVIGVRILIATSRKNITPEIMASAVILRDRFRSENRDSYEKNERQMTKLFEEKENQDD